MNWVILIISLLPFAIAGTIFLAQLLKNKVMHNRGYIKVYEEQPNKKIKSFYVKPEGNMFIHKGKTYHYSPNHEAHVFHQGILTTFYDKSRQQILFNTDNERYDQKLKEDESNYLSFIAGYKKAKTNEDLKKYLLFAAAGGAVIAAILGLMILGKIDDLMKVLQASKIVVG